MNTSSILSIVLHSRPYQDTSLIVDVFTEEHGRMAFVAKGARAQSRKDWRALLQMSSVVEVEYKGRGDLKTLVSVEALTGPKSFNGESFALSCYVSELLCRVMEPGEPFPRIFQFLPDVYHALAVKNDVQIVLRQLELMVLQDFGVAIDFSLDSSGSPIEPNLLYTLNKRESFSVCERGSTSGFKVEGITLLDIVAGRLNNPDALNALKHINRELLLPYLGNKPLQSRELWLQWQKNSSVNSRRC
ncbi:DNA repair protein RecO [Pleionea sediminis]|uniref:DNA repair protein RecO n=1 Tax=Pleionea sediminis TaxID=2569479 RepID=UPI001186BEEC|nr:DNA repair protein RecO [Pleionea sediminis]